MIREISKRQIELKTAQGERVVLIEALPNQSYERRHLPGAILLRSGQVDRLASQYLPNSGAEIVVYGEDEFSPEAEEAAGRLSKLGYGNVYVYRAGKRDWFEGGGFEEAVHSPPSAPPVRVNRFKESGHLTAVEGSDEHDRGPRLRGWLRGLTIVLALHGAVTIIRALRRSREKMRGTDEVSDLYVLDPAIDRRERKALERDYDRGREFEHDLDLERDASSFDAASGAE